MLDWTCISSLVLVIDEQILDAELSVCSFPSHVITMVLRVSSLLLGIRVTL